MQLYLYRFEELDEDGDPIDWGALTALSPDDIEGILTEQANTLCFEPGMHLVRIYPLDRREMVGPGIMSNFKRSYTLHITKEDE